MVEKWLQQVEVLMIRSLKDICGMSIKNYNDPSREEWILTWPGQIVQCVNCIFWTTEATEAITTETLADFAVRCTHQIEKCVKMVQGKLEPGNQITIEALIVIDVHGKVIF